MKKILSIVIIVLIMLGINTISMASELKLRLNLQEEKVETGAEIKVNIGIDNFTRKGDAKAIEFKLGYDKQRIEYKEINFKNGWIGSCISDGIVASKSGKVSQEEIIAEVIFIVKEDAKEGSAKIEAKKILTSSDGDEVEVSNEELILEIPEKKVQEQLTSSNNIIVYSISVVLAICIVGLLVFYIKSKKTK